MATASPTPADANHDRPSRWLVTGSGGFIGSYLVDLLLECGDRVYGLVHRPVDVSDRRRGLVQTSVDVLDSAAVASAVREAEPDVVVHLAAESLPQRSWQEPARTVQINVFGSLNVLDAVRATGRNPVQLVVCSSAEYAPGGDLLPEDGRLEPSSPYALSKIAQDHFALLYWRAYGMRLVRVRPFFVIGPRKTGDVCSDFARGIVAIERGEATALSVGNLAAVRDFLDVRDAVAGLVVLAERGEAGAVYNLCSGTGHRVGELLDELRRLARVPVEVQVNEAAFRPLDEPVRIGDNRRLRALGWQPLLPIERSLDDILEYWRGTAAE